MNAISAVPLNRIHEGYQICRFRKNVYLCKNFIRNSMDDKLFDDIRPYNDEEIPAALERVVKDPIFVPAMKFAAFTWKEN